ncbi:ATP synthase (F/14-kDa) subunit-domain-containing protein [Suillus placidus]|uniref:V-type proton ATPase subunit F n=1 Tax=Suillus placidus TaxID=48579 RepID=A0A9P7D9M0_9AGAM|nr:ATP synthase (F/14-kDa) subunit-domain-containing protein [Suillus placidus]
MASTTAFKDRNLIAVIGDERWSGPDSRRQDSITGLLLAGIGHINEHQRKNFLIVDSSKVFGVFHVIPCSRMSPETQISAIETAFQEFTQRKDIAIVLINQHIAEKIRPTVDRYQEAFPTLLEIPSKDHPYDPSKDSVLKRVQKLFGE